MSHLLSGSSYVFVLTFGTSSGDQGGNGTALGIKGAAVARFGKNSETEQDTTVFGGNANDPMKDGLGKTAANGKLAVSDLKAAMALSGDTLPQVAADGTGTITGTWRIVTSDGTANDKSGNLFAVVDETGTGAYSKGTQLTATSDMVGNGKGNVVQRMVTRALQTVGIQKRATNVGADAVSDPLSLPYSSDVLTRFPAVLRQGSCRPHLHRN